LGVDERHEVILPLLDADAVWLLRELATHELECAVTAGEAGEDDVVR
jgi:hypothetical protein